MHFTLALIERPRLFAASKTKGVKNVYPIRTAIDPATAGGESAHEHRRVRPRRAGLLQNLVVAPLSREKRRYRIISGERGFRALKLLEKRGDITADFKVPVEIRSSLSKDDTLRLATIENLQREDLPPLDQAVALAGLVRKGTTPDDLIAKTGLSATTVKRRLALNTLCKPLANALRSAIITLAQAEPLTLGSAERRDEKPNSADRIRGGPESVGRLESPP